MTALSPDRYLRDKWVERKDLVEIGLFYLDRARLFVDKNALPMQLRLLRETQKGFAEIKNWGDAQTALADPLQGLNNKSKTTRQDMLSLLRAYHDLHEEEPTVADNSIDTVSVTVDPQHATDLNGPPIPRTSIASSRKRRLSQTFADDISIAGPDITEPSPKRAAREKSVTSNVEIPVSASGSTVSPKMAIAEIRSPRVAQSRAVESDSESPATTHNAIDSHMGAVSNEAPRAHDRIEDFAADSSSNKTSIAETTTNTAKLRTSSLPVSPRTVSPATREMSMPVSLSSSTGNGLNTSLLDRPQQSPGQVGMRSSSRGNSPGDVIQYTYRNEEPDRESNDSSSKHPVIEGDSQGRESAKALATDENVEDNDSNKSSPLTVILAGSRGLLASGTTFLAHRVTVRGIWQLLAASFVLWLHRDEILSIQQAAMQGDSHAMMALLKPLLRVLGIPQPILNALDDATTATLLRETLNRSTALLEGTGEEGVQEIAREQGLHTNASLGVNDLQQQGRIQSPQNASPEAGSAHAPNSNPHRFIEPVSHHDQRVAADLRNALRHRSRSQGETFDVKES